MSEFKFGVMVKWPDGWTWVTEIRGPDADTPVKFPTETDAEEHAEIWRKPGKEHLVKVMPIVE